MVVMRSCCCCSPRTGTLLISVIYMLFTGIILVGLGLTLGYFTNYLQPIAISIIHDLPGNATSSLTASVLGSMDSIRNVIIASIVLTSLYFFLCLLLFVGASKESSGYLTPWLVAEFFRQLIFFVAFCFLAWFIGASVYKDLVQDDIETGFMALFCIVMLSTIDILFLVSLFHVAALVFYFWLAVVGASQEFKEKETRISPETKEHHQQTIHEAYIIYE